MKRHILTLLIGLVLLPFAGTLDVCAQHNPNNPPEPYFYYKVTVTCDPAGVGSVSGAGKYLSGKQVWINTSRSNSNYTFSHWTLNGERISDTAGFYYTTEAQAANFVAHYDYMPSNPSEPVSIIRNRLYLECSPAGCASFNTASGDRRTVDQWISLRTYANQGYDFLGWYQGDQLVSNVSTFSYCMPDHEVTLTARFKYNPVNPGEPEGTDQENIRTHLKGDVNRDGVVDISDAVAIINYYMAQTTDPEIIILCDMNCDGVIDISDAVIVTNIYHAE